MADAKEVLSGLVGSGDLFIHQTVDAAGKALGDSVLLIKKDSERAVRDLGVQVVSVPQFPGSVVNMSSLQQCIGSKSAAEELLSVAQRREAGPASYDHLRPRGEIAPSALRTNEPGTRSR